MDKQVPAKTGIVEPMPLSARSKQVVETGLAEYQRVRDQLADVLEELRRSESTRQLHEAELALRDNEIIELRQQIRELTAQNNELIVRREVMRSVVAAIKVNVNALCEPLAEKEEPAAPEGEDIARAAE